jgi:hypothetical protein
MRAGPVIRIEKNVDRAAAVVFAMAAAYAAYSWFAARVGQPALGIETAIAFGCAFVASAGALSAVQPEQRKVPVTIFDLRKIEPSEPELLLTDRYEGPATTNEPLVLDDVLTELEPDSRVVRLFDPAAMPTPGQLNARIERHLGRDAPPDSSQDASQALHDALHALRRSLR